MAPGERQSDSTAITKDPQGVGVFCYCCTSGGVGGGVSIGQVLIPRRVYSPQNRKSPVKRSTTPRSPHQEFIMSPSPITRIPTTMRTVRSMPPTFFFIDIDMTNKLSLVYRIRTLMKRCLTPLGGVCILSICKNKKRNKRSRAPCSGNDCIWSRVRSKVSFA